MSERQTGDRVAIIRREEYLPFTDQEHLFLTGDLQQPNAHPFFRDTRLEWILCFYEAGDDGVAHWHPDVTEYEMVLEGEVGYFEPATGETNWFRPGDFSAIPAGVCVQRIVRERSRTVAIKVPSNAERVVCSGCTRDCASRVNSYRQESEN